jgi:hypothetical protein
LRNYFYLPRNARVNPALLLALVPSLGHALMPLRRQTLTKVSTFFSPSRNHGRVWCEPAPTSNVYIQKLTENIETSSSVTPKVRHPSLFVGPHNNKDLTISLIRYKSFISTPGMRYWKIDFFFGGGEAAVIHVLK